MFVELEKPVTVGTIVKFELDLESSPDTVRGTAEVVWIRSDKISQEKPAGVGLQFRHLEGEGKAIVRSAVEEVLQAQGLSVEPAAVLQPKPRARPKRARPKSAPSRATPPPPRMKQTGKKRRKKQAPERSKKKESPGEDRKKLIVAIILVLILMYVLSRALG